MFSRNLKYYRLRLHLSKKELATQVGVSAATISNYESGARRPNMEILKGLAKSLQVNVADFLNARYEKLIFSHGEFRKNVTCSKAEQELVREAVEEYFSRFYTVIDILGDKVLPVAPLRHQLPITDDVERDASALRQYLGLATEGPLADLVTILENKGILLYACEIDSHDFSGINGCVNDRPYIAYNAQMTAERIRFSLAHELVHLFFALPLSMNERSREKLADAIGGAFLLPQSDVVRELGMHRSAITKDMLLVCEEYGLSLLLVASRAKELGIVSKESFASFRKWAGSHNWRQREPSKVECGGPNLFKQLVFRAISEQEISVVKGSELLRIPSAEIFAACCFNEA